MRAPRVSPRALSFTLAVAALVWGCAEVGEVTAPSVGSIPANAFDVVQTSAGTVYVCPVGPAGTYNYQVSVTVQPTWTFAPFSGTWSAANIAQAEANQTLIASPVYSAGTCTLVFQINETLGFDRGDGVGIDAIRDVTVQEISAPTDLDSIVVVDDFNGTYTTLGPATTVTVDANRFHGSVASFYHSQPTEITPCPAGTFTYTYFTGGDLNIKYDQFPAPNDNSYGVNAVGWGTKGHKFSDLTGSDHAGFQLVDGNGVVKLSFNVDYLSAQLNAPSGYASLGVLGGDGKMLVGTADGISATTSLDRNLNGVNIPGLFVNKVQQFGSVNLLVNSPPVSPANTYNNTDVGSPGTELEFAL